MAKLIVAILFLPWLAQGRRQFNSQQKGSIHTLAEARVQQRSVTRNFKNSLATFLLASSPTHVINPAALRTPHAAARLPTKQPSRHPYPIMQSAAAKVEKWAKEEKIGPYIKIGKDKVINWYGGIVFAVPALFFGIFWYAAMTILGGVCDKTGWNPKRSLYDNLGRYWNFLVLHTTGNYPQVVTGLENRPEEGQAVLICANHASWYDILLAGYTLPATFKFISAAELAELPGVGKQLNGGKHVLIDRSSRRGQLKAFREALDWLSKGVSIFAFPEGTRSRDGKLKRFKGGVFSMALKAGVPILPVTIVNQFDPYPPNALLPIRKSTDMEMHFHKMIDTEGRTEEELQTLVRAAILSKLPAHQLPDSEDERDDIKLVTG